MRDDGDSRPEIVISFSNYEPPFDVAIVVGRMLDSVPLAYLNGLKRIFLTNSAGLTRKRRRSVTKSRKRKVRIVETRGLYHPEWQGTGAWIEIFVDNTLKKWDSSFWRRLPLIREFDISDVLFHEIGHHIHYTSRPEFREREDVADVWKVRLEGNYLRRRFAGLRMILRPVYLAFLPIIRRQRARIGKRMLEAGAISRAELEEDMRGFAPKASGPAK